VLVIHAVHKRKPVPTHLRPPRPAPTDQNDNTFGKVIQQRSTLEMASERDHVSLFLSSHPQFLNILPEHPFILTMVTRGAESAVLFCSENNAIRPLGLRKEALGAGDHAV
jgi:pyridoxine 5'-phosphate synthase PdxJ